MEGKNSLRKKIGLLCVLSALFLAMTGCDALFPQEEERLPPVLIEPQRVEYVTYPAQRKTIENAVSGYGVVEAANQTDVSVTDMTGGILTAVHFKEGDWVEEGQLLIELDNAAIKDTLEETRMRAEIAELVYAKARTQYQNGEIDQVAWKTAQLNIYLSRKNLQKLEDQLATTQFFSPVAGKIVYRRDMTIGAPVGKDVICTVADTDELVVRYMGIRSDELPLGAVCDGVIRGDTSGKVYSLEVIAPSLNNPSLHQSILRSQEPLPENIELGSQIDLRYVLERSENTITVPRRAVQNLGTRTYVYIYADGYKQERDVQIGILSSDEAELVAGIAEGELIIY